MARAVQWVPEVRAIIVSHDLYPKVTTKHGIIVMSDELCACTLALGLHLLLCVAVLLCCCIVVLLYCCFGYDVDACVCPHTNDPEGGARLATNLCNHRRPDTWEKLPASAPPPERDPTLRDAAESDEKLSSPPPRHDAATTLHGHRDVRNPAPIVAQRRACSLCPRTAPAGPRRPAQKEHRPRLQRTATAELHSFLHVETRHLSHHTSTSILRIPTG